MPETPVTQQMSQKSQMSNVEKRSILSEIDSMEYEKNKDVPIDILCEPCEISKSIDEKIFLRCIFNHTNQISVLGHQEI